MNDTTESSEIKLPSSDPRIRCFERCGEEDAFETSVMNLIGRMQKDSRANFVSEQNTLRMNHGSNWVHAARDPEPDTSMHTISAEWTIPFKDIAENDLTLIYRTILPMNEEMDKQFTQNMYGVIGAAANRVGNVVDAKAQESFGHSMLEMFRKIEFGVDRDGNVSMPQMHVGPELYAQLPDKIAKVPPEITAEIEQVKAKKIQAAHVRESERKAKFKQVLE